MVRIGAIDVRSPARHDPGLEVVGHEVVARRLVLAQRRSCRPRLGELTARVHGVPDDGLIPDHPVDLCRGKNVRGNSRGGIVNDRWHGGRDALPAPARANSGAIRTTLIAPVKSLLNRELDCMFPPPPWTRRATDVVFIPCVHGTATPATDETRSRGPHVAGEDDDRQIGVSRHCHPDRTAVARGDGEDIHPRHPLFRAPRIR